jgi:hypothetical protein
MLLMVASNLEHRVDEFCLEPLDLRRTYQTGLQLEIIVVIIASAASAFTAFSFYKAGKFKLTASKETMLQAGFGWLEKFPVSAARIIAVLELLGALGLIVAPIAYFVGLTWTIWFAVAAGAGLALTMIVATILHQVRGESKYTAKMTLSLLAVSAISAAGWAILPLI